MRALFPNGISVAVSQEQANKIRFIQDCIRKQRARAAAASREIKDKNEF